jgi:hypothetical protein
MADRDYGQRRRTRDRMRSGTAAQGGKIEGYTIRPAGKKINCGEKRLTMIAVVLIGGCMALTAVWALRATGAATNEFLMMSASA